MTDLQNANPELDSKLVAECELTEGLDDAAATHPNETLLDQLDRRQNSVLKELDELDTRIQALVRRCQNHRSEAT